MEHQDQESQHQQQEQLHWRRTSNEILQSFRMGVQ
jgi:hypothetical protein